MFDNKIFDLFRLYNGLNVFVFILINFMLLYVSYSIFILLIIYDDIEWFWLCCSFENW